jgi:transposase
MHYISHPPLLDFLLRSISWMPLIKGGILISPLCKFLSRFLPRLIRSSDFNYDPQQYYRFPTQTVYGTDVSESIHNQIGGMRLYGVPFPIIEAQLEVKVNTAKKIFHHWQESGTYKNAPRTGQPKKINEHDLIHICHHLQHDQDKCHWLLGGIILDFNLPICERTLEQTIVNDLGMGHRIEHKTLWLLKKQKEARLAFEKLFNNWTLDN